MALRNAPNSSTGYSAYELMFGRRIRTRLDLMKATNTNKGEFHQESRKIRKMLIGEKVQVRNFSDKTGKWKFGRIVKQEGLLHYIIKMNNGLLWRRHVNHIRSCKITGED